MVQIDSAANSSRVMGAIVAAAPSSSVDGWVVADVVVAGTVPSVLGGAAAESEV
ncbi:MAG: hypothetical protein AAF531_17815 [Actinomycetota bacterium]